jgi:hypothetical protein
MTTMWGGGGKKEKKKTELGNVLNGRTSLTTVPFTNATGLYGTP